MSVPAENTFMSALYDSVGGSSSPYYGGVVNPYSGLNLSGLGGQPSTSNAITNLLGVLGPVGSVAGGALSLVPGLDGFLQNGFDFTCLGAQAYKKSNLENDLGEFKRDIDKTNPANIEEVEYIVNHLSRHSSFSAKAISKYKSGCSKKLRGQLKEFLDKCIGEILPKYPNKTFVEVKEVHPKEGEFTYKKYTLSPVTASVSPNLVLPPDMSKLTPAEFETTVKPAVIAYAQQNGLNVDEAIKTAYNEIFGTPAPTGSGSVAVDENGNVYWNVEAGNQKTNYLMWLLGGAGVLLLVKMLKNK